MPHLGQVQTCFIELLLGARLCAGLKQKTSRWGAGGTPVEPPAGLPSAEGKGRAGLTLSAPLFPSWAQGGHSEGEKDK